MGRRSARNHQVGARAKEPGDRHRGYPERRSIGMSEETGRLAPLFDIHQIARNQPIALERLPISDQPTLTVHATIDEVIGDPWQVPPRHARYIVRVDGVADLHGLHSPHA